jgi:hypothetical protein
MITASELPIKTVREGTTARDMADAIFGEGVEVKFASYRGDRDSAGIFSNGDAISPGVVPGDSGVILSTGDAEDFTNSSGPANQSTRTSTNTSGENNNSQFNAAAGARTFDASYLDVDFIPNASVLTMQFVFSSEEYPEFENSIYQDFIGVWVNGSKVSLDVGNGDVDPGNINSSSNINMFLDNARDDFNTEMDGFTITLTLTMFVSPNELNSIRIAIADVSDFNYDSNLLIAADSIQTEIVAISDNVNLLPDASKTIDVLANDINNGPGTLTVTHINGKAVVAGDTITLPTGQKVTLNADGTLTVVGDGDEEDFNFTYGITNGGNTDVGFVNATSIPCFVAGTLIETAQGDIPVERLRVGDMVRTQDHGLQPLRWIGQRQVAAEGDFAPVRIMANTFGEHRPLLVSPQHRILIKNPVAALLFGEEEVLVAAKDLVNGRSVQRLGGGTVSYVHLMFDAHQIVFSEGLATESFLPGPQTSDLFEQAVLDEITALFPDMDPATGAGYGHAVRRMLKRYETELLLSVNRAA